METKRTLVYFLKSMESVPLVPLMYNISLSAGGAVLANSLVKEFSKLFAKLRMQGADMCKKSRSMIPQPMGVVTAAVYMIILFLFIPAPFYRWIYDNEPMFPYHRFVEFLSGVLSICSMIFLGFADDILDLRWRHKLLLPSIATLPLLMVYAVNSNSTSVVVPIQLQPIFGSILYYAYIGMLAVFCTNAINIYAGINGLEVGQSLSLLYSALRFHKCSFVAMELVSGERVRRYDESTDRLSYSVAQFKAKELTQLGTQTLRLFERFGLVAVKEKIEDGETLLECSNFTLINLALKLFGPMHEKSLALLLISLQPDSSFMWSNDSIRMSDVPLFRTPAFTRLHQADLSLNLFRSLQVTAPFHTDEPFPKTPNPSSPFIDISRIISCFPKLNELTDIQCSAVGSMSQWAKFEKQLCSYRTPTVLVSCVIV
ncbi:hypothetical protein D918_01547 [Trichuris suis]|nr:hypothetical protein D918_01547 [Trichuris suis]